MLVHNTWTVSGPAVATIATVHLPQPDDDRFKKKCFSINTGGHLPFVTCYVASPFFIVRLRPRTPTAFTLAARFYTCRLLWYTRATSPMNTPRLSVFGILLMLASTLDAMAHDT